MYIGGRVVLIKSVIYALPIYFLSLFKAPTCIIYKLDSIFKQFLWGESENERKINWVQWNNICKPEDEWGLEIKNLTFFNKALLEKWKWKINLKTSGLWLNTLNKRYEILEVLNGIASNRDSKWWEGVCNLEIGKWKTQDTFRLQSYTRIFYLASCFTLIL